jgi:hypothetical protein
MTKEILTRGSFCRLRVWQKGILSIDLAGKINVVCRAGIRKQVAAELNYLSDKTKFAGSANLFEGQCRAKNSR